MTTAYVLIAILICILAIFALTRPHKCRVQRTYIANGRRYYEDF